MHVLFMQYLVLKHSHVLIKLKKIAKIASQSQEKNRNRKKIASQNCGKIASQKNRIAVF